MPFRIFRLRTLRGANVVGLLDRHVTILDVSSSSHSTCRFLHFSPIKTGLSYLPLAVGIIVSAGAASQLVTRIGFKPP